MPADRVQTFYADNSDYTRTTRSHITPIHESKKSNCNNVTLGTDADGEKNERTIKTNHIYTCIQNFNAAFSNSNAQSIR